jgi:hypothetical protein
LVDGQPIVYFKLVFFPNNHKGRAVKVPAPFVDFSRLRFIEEKDKRFAIEIIDGIGLELLLDYFFDTFGESIFPVIFGVEIESVLAVKSQAVNFVFVIHGF